MQSTYNALNGQEIRKITKNNTNYKDKRFTKSRVAMPRLKSRLQANVPY